MSIYLRDSSELLDLEGFSGTPSHGVQVFNYDILHCEWDEDDEKTETLGSVEITLFHPDEVHPEDLMDAADSLSRDCVDVASFFFGDSGPLALDSFEETGGIRDLMYINNINLNADHRGKDLGLQIVRALFYRHGGNMHVALHPAPTEEGPRISRKKGAKKLRAYWKRLGFAFEDKKANLLWNNVALISEFPNPRPPPARTKGGLSLYTSDNSSRA